MMLNKSQPGLWQERLLLASSQTPIGALERRFVMPHNGSARLPVLDSESKLQLLHWWWRKRVQTSPSNSAGRTLAKTRCAHHW